MKRFVITEEEKKFIMGMYLLEQQPTGTTVSQTGGTVNRQMNRPPCIGGGLTSLGCWLDEIDKVQREIGNPKTWTMDSYNRLQKTLYDYKNWRETTPEGQAVQDSHNQKDEYVVQLPDHLKTVNESVGTKSFIRLTESELTRLIKRIVKENEMSDDDMSDDYYGMDMEGDDENLDMDPLSQFTPEELNNIYDTVGRLSQPGFFEDDEAESYLFYTAAKEDKNLYDSLVDWLEKNGIDNPRLRQGHR
jgi:hypothetical protein